MQECMYLEMGNLRVGHEDVHTVLSILFVVAFCLKDELFEDAVIPRNDAKRDASHFS